jgi:hypothetical protein
MQAKLTKLLSNQLVFPNQLEYYKILVGELSQDLRDASRSH